MGQRIKWSLQFSYPITRGIDLASIEPAYPPFLHVTVHDLVKVLEPVQPPSGEVSPEGLWVLQTLFVQGGMVGRDGRELERVADSTGGPLQDLSSEQMAILHEHTGAKPNRGHLLQHW